MSKHDPIKILKQEHQQVRDLLSRLGDNGPSDALDAAIEAIEMHTELEEELLYPAFYQVAADGDEEHLYFESLEEHAVVESVVAELDPRALDLEVFQAKVKVMKDLVLNHLEEEESQLFPLIRKLCSSEQLTELGVQMREFRGEEVEPSSPEQRADGAERRADGADRRAGEADRRGRDSGRIDLNRASADELQKIAGIDDVRATRIVEYRESHGRFGDWSELDAIEGFDVGMVKAIRDQSTLGR